MRLIGIIEGDIPEDWWLDPAFVCYLEGAGQPVERTRENGRQMIAQYGVASLQLEHRPDLMTACAELAGLAGGAR